MLLSILSSSAMFFRPAIDSVYLLLSKGELDAQADDVARNVTHALEAAKSGLR
jgi:hypothetical protein